MFSVQAIFLTKSFNVSFMLDEKTSHVDDDFDWFEGFRGVEVWKRTENKLEYGSVLKWNNIDK